MISVALNSLNKISTCFKLYKDNSEYNISIIWLDLIRVSDYVLIVYLPKLIIYLTVYDNSSVSFIINLLVFCI